MKIAEKANIDNQKRLAFWAGLFVLIVLTAINLKPGKSLLIAERLIIHGGWIQIALSTAYALFIAWKMYPIAQTAKWRVRIWSWFSIIFFSQLCLGLLGLDDFLMTGKLHFPIPAMIIAGPIYRADLSIMTLIFISTLLLSGSAWCSQLCYFGAIDAIVAKGKSGKNSIPFKYLRHYILLLVIAVALILHLFNIRGWLPIAMILFFGLFAFVVMQYFSKKLHKMVHCSVYCLVGTVVAYYGKWVSPFSIKINNDCNQCMHCTTACKYDALKITDIYNKKAGFGCTTCGDCLSTCHSQSIIYHSRWLNPQTTRWLYLLTTIILHVLFLNMARI